MTTCMMTYPPARCTLPVGHDGPHATRDGHGWHDHDDMGGGVTAVLIEKEAEESPSVDYEAMWWEAERRAEKAEAERDRWHSMWRQRRIKNLAAEKRAARADESRPLAPADITLHSANSASWVRVRVEHPALGVIEEGVPLPTRSVPNVVTDEMVKRGMGALGELHEDGDLIVAERVRKAKAEAWDECEATAIIEDAPCSENFLFMVTHAPNPYRESETACQ